MSDQQSSALTTSGGQLGLGVIEEIDDVTTTRLTPASFAAVSTLIVPLMAGSRSCFCKCPHPPNYNSHTLEKKSNPIKNQLQLQEDLDRSTNLGILDLIDDAGRGQVEDAGAATNSAENGRVVEEINLEETETSFSSSSSSSSFYTFF